MNPMLLAGLDVLVVAVLLYAVYYMRIVAKSIVVIRDGKNEMQQMLKEMTGAISRAEGTIAGMKNLADDRGKFLQKQMDSAATLIEELKFINQAADHVAQRLEKGVAGTGGTGLPELKAPPKNTGKPAASHVSKAEKDLATALAKRQDDIKQGAR